LSEDLEFVNIKVIEFHMFLVSDNDFIQDFITHWTLLIVHLESTFESASETDDSMITCTDSKEI